MTWLYPLVSKLNQQPRPGLNWIGTFHKLDDQQTRVTLQMDYEPEGFLENVGDKLGFVSSRLKGDMDNFKTFIESRQAATGEWRGTIEQN